MMLSTGCPGILLYGRRRRGKSTILRNLVGAGLLPTHIQSGVVSMQSPHAFSSLQHFCQTIAAAIPDAPPNQMVQGLASLFDALAAADARLAEAKQRLLLAVDEYELIDKKIGEGVFTEDLLSAVRESIQTHRNLTWVFAGSHRFDELKAGWSSYLVSVRTIEVPCFTPDETRMLLTDPLRCSAAWREDDPKRLRYAAEMWGEAGIERIQTETGGWPHFVQLLAQTLIDRLNESGLSVATPALMEGTLDEAVVRGEAVFYELLRGESMLPGEWEYVAAFRDYEEQPLPDDEALRRSLRRREIVVEEGGRIRLCAPLFYRWLRASNW